MCKRHSKRPVEASERKGKKKSSKRDAGARAPVHIDRAPFGSTSKELRSAFNSPSKEPWILKKTQFPRFIPYISSQIPSLTSNPPRNLENSPTCFTRSRSCLSARRASLGESVCSASLWLLASQRSARNASQHAGSTVSPSACSPLPTSVILMLFRASPCLSVKLTRTAKPVIRNGS